MVPFYLISEDARYITVNAKDLYNRERLIFSQYNGHVTAYKHILGPDDIYTMETSVHDAIYAHIEKLPLLGIDPSWKDNIDFQRKVDSPVSRHFFVLSNGCATAKINWPGNSNVISRYPVYKEWIHDAFKDSVYADAKVYGVWSEETYKQNDWIQNKLIVDMPDDIADCRYSFVYSQIPGFVTAKAYELICLGIIPFIHPDYDPERLLNLPEFLYVKSPEEMLGKMKMFDNDHILYLQALHKCIDAIKPEYHDGTLVINGIFRHIATALGWDEYEDASGVDVVMNHFSKSLVNKK